MSKKMLIDASRGDETRVVVMVDGRIEEIDYETADRRPIKSNIYLARVTRVEPSLQAAFVDYGGNRHGFLPFSEIHPDYYQLPVADREALLSEVEAKVEERRQRHLKRRSSPRRANAAAGSDGAVTAVDPDGEQPHVEFPVDENGDFIQPQPLSAESSDVEAVTPEAEASGDDTPTVEMQAETEAEDASATDTVAATLGLDETLTEQAIVDQEANTATVSMTQADDATSSDDNGEGDDDEPAKTVTAATGTDEEESVSEEADSAPEDDSDNDSDEEEDSDVAPEQVAAEGEESDEDEAQATGSTDSDGEGGIEEIERADNVIEEAGSGEGTDDSDDDDSEASAESNEEDDDEDTDEGAAKKPRRRRRRSRRGGRKEAKNTSDDNDDNDNDDDDDEDEPQSSDDDFDVDEEEEDDEDAIFEEDAERRAVMHSIISRRYKIQEVIKRRQVMLVQVTKEERGNKGAALSSYLSLAGRYCVYMPNTTRGGGISRKISSPKDRRRLKTILDDLDLPQDISIIVRTAGSQRTKAEIKRDYEYLRRTWDGIRETTLTSMAPSLIYEEANVMKRAIRDMYSSDMEEVQVEGEEGYKDAKNFMRVLTPSHAKRVKQHKNEGVSLFQSHKAEQQLDALFNPVVTLKSGGYLVMNQTEALVAVDVNSGKATKERSIEETALATNLEAAEEVARQLRLRDLAGLVVIDFIDMDESKHRGQVERRLKESMRGDRARIQLGRISPFGLLELSRQRIRPSVFETTMVGCSVCGGVGVVRSSGSLASSIMRRIGDLLLERETLDRIEVDAPTDAALKLLNEHREELANLESQFGVRISILPNAHLFSPHFHLRVYTDEKVETFSEGYTTDPTAPKKGDRRRGRRSEQRSSSRSDDDDEGSSSRSGRGRGRGRGRNARSDDEESRTAEAKDAEVDASADDDAEGEGQSRRQRGKRGGRRRGRKDTDAAAIDAAETEDDAASTDAADADAADANADGETEKPKRRRGKRGGRNRRKGRGVDTENSENSESTGEEGDSETAAAADDKATESEAEAPVSEATAAPEPDGEDADGEVSEGEVSVAEADAQADADDAEQAKKPAKKTRSRSRKKPKAEEAPAAESDEQTGDAVEPEATETATETESEAANEPVQQPEAEPEATEAATASETDADAEPHVAVEPDTPKKDGPRRRGWWSRGK